MPMRGRLTDWNDDRGFGYIKPVDGGPTVFVHISQFPRDQRRPLHADLLEFEIGHDERGRSRAVDVRYLSAARYKGTTSGASSPEAATISLPALIASGGALAVLCLLAALQVTEWLVPLVYLAMSVVTFVAYGEDKRLAQTGGYRISEAALIGFGLVGGWPGALLAQGYFRHKTRKQPFRTVFFLSIAVNLGLLALLTLLP